MLDFSFFRDPVFCAFYAFFVGFAAGNFVPMAHLVRYAMDKGVPAAEAARLMSICGLTEMVGTVAGGMVGDRLGPFRAFAATTFTVGIFSLLLPLALQAGGGYAALSVYIGVYGMLGRGPFVPLWILCLSRLFGVANVPAAMGLTTTTMILGGFMVTFAGWIFDTTGSYTAAWVLIGALLLYACCGFLLLPVLDRRFPNRCCLADEQHC